MDFWVVPTYCDYNVYWLRLGGRREPIVMLANAKLLEPTYLPIADMPDVEAFSPFQAIYRSKQRGGGVPAWSDFGFADFAGWHSRLCVTEREGDNLRVRIFGTYFAELCNADFTGDLLYGRFKPDQAEFLKAYFDTIIHTPCIGWSLGKLPIEGRDFLNFEVMDLPVTDDAGEVTRILHVCVSSQSPLNTQLSI